MINVFQENFIRVDIDTRLGEDKIRVGDKVILQLKNNKVLQGELCCRIGRKHIYLRTQPLEFYGHRCLFNSEDIKIEDIKTIKKFSNNSQKLGEILYRKERWI